MRSRAFMMPEQFQSTLPAWGATSMVEFLFDTCTISIHAPRVGSDLVISTRLAKRNPISIHAPRVGSDVCHFGLEEVLEIFQSTLPAWGAT